MSTNKLTVIDRAADAAVDFLKGLGTATKGVPGAMGQAWKDSHTRTPWLREWEEDQNYGELGGRPILFVDSRAEASYDDHRLWRLLGRVSDALIFIMVFIILALVGMAAGL